MQGTLQILSAAMFPATLHGPSLGAMLHSALLLSNKTNRCFFENTSIATISAPCDAMVSLSTPRTQPRHAVLQPMSIEHTRERESDTVCHGIGGHEPLNEWNAKNDTLYTCDYDIGARPTAPLSRKRSSFT